jgi:hypothetical protein
MNRVRTVVGSASIADVDEDEIVRWLFTECPVKDCLFGELGIAIGSRFLLKVPRSNLPAMNDGPGDIDFLCSPAAMPAQSTAIECKQIKFPADVVASGRAKQVQEHIDYDRQKLEKGAIQVNGLVKDAFWRAFLLVIFEVDASTTPSMNPVKSLFGSQIASYRALINGLNLDPAVGIAWVEVTQLSSRSVDMEAGIPMKVLKQPSVQQQPDCLTAEIGALFRRECSGALVAC